jgi:hypothetical protein
MTPKEKAEQLANYYMPFCSNNYYDAKQCALIAVDELLSFIEDDRIGFSSKDYYKKVKQEINNL